MKKILICLMAAVLMLPTMSVFAATETPEAPTKKRQSVHTKRDVACPPSYVGKSATCVFIPNPDFDKRTVTTPRRTIPTTNPTAYYWAMYGAMDIVSKTETGKRAVDTFWNDVDKVDQTAGQIMNKLIDGNVDTTAYEDAWNAGLMAGNRTATISKDLYDKLWDATTSVLGGMSGFESIKERNKETPINYPSGVGIVTLDSRGGGIATVYGDYEFALIRPDGTTWGRDRSVSCSGDLKNGYTSCGFNGGHQTMWHDKVGKMPSSIASFASWLGTTWTGDVNRFVLRNSKTGEQLKATETTRIYPDGVTAHGNVIDISIPPSIGTDGRQLPEESEVDGKPYIEDEKPSKDLPIYVPPMIERMPGLAPRQDVEGVFIPEAVVVEKGTGKVVYPDGTVGKNPVTDPDGLVTPKPDAVVPPALPPKDTKAPTGEDLPTKDAEEEGNRWKALVTNKFPFSLPWDVYGILKVLTVDPERPEIDINTETKMAGVSVPIKMKHDFAWMDEIIPFVRTLILISFIIFLIMKTRTLMGGAQ